MKNTQTKAVSKINSVLLWSLRPGGWPTLIVDLRGDFLLEQFKEDQGELEEFFGSLTEEPGIFCLEIEDPKELSDFDEAIQVEVTDEMLRNLCLGEPIWGGASKEGESDD